MFNSEQLEKTWAPVLESKDAPPFKDNYRKAVTAVLLENQKKALREEREQASFLNESTGTAAVSNWDPVLISLVRRSMPNLIAYDIAGVQPMTMPTGLIFAMRSHFQSPTNGNKEAFMNTKADGTSGVETAFSGSVSTATGEALSGNATLTGETGTGGGFGNMGFTVDKSTVTAKTRALKAEYTMELAQDLKAVHGLDAESELANILTTEILAEINREIIGVVNAKAKQGAVSMTAAGTFDIHVDADGRWAKEKFQSLMFQLEVEANEIAKSTRRGKGNFIVCSSNVASALAAAGVLDYTPALSTNLNVDDTGNTFAGVINGRLKVFIDPYSTADYITVGYRGANAYDAGLFYCPYVPLTMVRAIDQNTFQPKIGFKTRYGLSANPFALIDGSGNIGSGLGTDATNPYFRKFLVTGIGAVA